MTTAFLPGVLTGLALIVAIGAQNAFVLRQGIRRQHLGVVVAICIASDVVLINQVAEYIVGAGGKRLRPMLLLLASGAAGGEAAAARGLPGRCTAPRMGAHGPAGPRTGTPPPASHS